MSAVGVAVVVPQLVLRAGLHPGQLFADGQDGAWFEPEGFIATPENTFSGDRQGVWFEPEVTA